LKERKVAHHLDDTKTGIGQKKDMFLLGIISNIPGGLFIVRSHR
jgi:hypothetical protein